MFYPLPCEFSWVKMVAYGNESYLYESDLLFLIIWNLFGNVQENVLSDVLFCVFIQSHKMFKQTAATIVLDNSKTKNERVLLRRMVAVFWDIEV